MAHKIIMPKQGLQMTEGIITSWLKPEGAQVREGDPLFEIETDKLTLVIDSIASGTLLKILHKEGDVVPVADIIAIVGEPGEIASAAAGRPGGIGEGVATAAGVSVGAAANASKRIFITPRAKLRAQERHIEYARLAGSGPDGLIVERDIEKAITQDAASATVQAATQATAQAITAATPLAKKIALSEGVDISAVAGSGARGKIMAQDVHAAALDVRTAAQDVRTAAQDVRTADQGAPRGEKRIRLAGVRKIIAQRMKQSLLEQAQANHRMKVDMGEAVRLREQLKAAGIKISYNDIVLRCAAKALTEFPMMNASIAGDDIVQKEYVNLGVAVATDAGLFVPVLRDADRMTLQEIAEASALAASRAKEGKLAPDDLSGGTFTVTNLGMFDVDGFTAIINAPEAGILAVGKLSKQPAVVGDELCIRPMMELSLTYDHRIVDGAPAARFLQRIKALLEQPYLLV